MDWRALAAVALLSAGCLQADDAADATAVQAFEARYGLRFERPSGGPMDGELLLRLSGPTTIADRDGALRPAYLLETREALWPAGGFGSAEDAPPILHHLDGRLLLARSDCHEGPSPLFECGAGQPSLHWEVQGSPPPFGVLWPEQVRYQADGAWADADTRLGGGLRGLPAGSLLPFGPHLDPDLRFAPGPGGVPRNFTLAMALLDGRLQGWLESVAWGDALPPIDPWPMPERPGLGRPFRFVPGEDEEAFRMGITFRQAYEELLNRSEPARAAFAAACAHDAILYYGGGTRWNTEGDDAVLDPVIGRHDTAAFQLQAIAPSAVETWEIRYTTSPGALERALGQTGYTDVEAREQRQGDECAAREARSVFTVNEALLKAWRLGTRGTPCGLVVWPGVYERAGSAKWVRSGTWLLALLDESEENDGWGRASPAGFVTYDGEDGRITMLASTPDDLAALDAGTLAEREVPTEQANPVLPPSGFRCVPPAYVEFL